MKLLGLELKNKSLSQLIMKGRRTVEKFYGRGILECN